MTDVELFEKHRTGDEEAFAELVKRHIGWVYGMAQRRLRDRHLSEDVAQAVFVLLFRKRPRFPSDSALIAWLHKSAWYATETAAKIERRRQRRETEAAILQPKETDPGTGDEWQRLAPMLDALIGKLARTDREAVLLRYYRGMSFAEVGAEIGATEESARKRVDRAIEKLRQMAAANGASLSAAVLVGHLGVHIVVTPPVGLAAVATGAAAAPAGSALAASSGTIVKGAIFMMASTKAVIAGAVGVGLILCVGGTIWKVAHINADATPTIAPVSKAAPAEDIAAPGAAVTYPKLSPFAAVRWNGSTYEVKLDGNWYALYDINTDTIAKIIAFAQEKYPTDWQKRIDEDLVELLTDMGHPPGEKVNLILGVPGTTDSVIMLGNVAMTEENRRAIWLERNKELTTNPAAPGADRGPAATAPAQATQLP